MTGHNQTSLSLALPGGSAVGYAIYGDPEGAPVLALHGAPACRLMFAVADVDARQLGLKLYAPDRPGYGLTPIDRQPTLQSRTRWLTEFVDALGLGRFGVLGISGGSPYAVSLAAALGGRVTGLALVSPMGPAADYAASAEAQHDPIPFLQRRFFLHLAKRTWLTEPIGGLGARIFCSAPERFSGWVPQLAGRADAAILAQPHVRAKMIPMTVEAFRQGPLGGTSDLQVFSQPWHVDYTRITGPAVMWQGTADGVVPPVAAYYLAKQIPKCRLHRIEGAGHFWIFNQTGEVMREARGYLTGEANHV